jgi:uncharacterized protein DUF1844
MEKHMADQTNDESAPKIIIDSDWKQDAAAEKERLAKEAEASSDAVGEIPEPSLIELVNMIVMQASVGLGGYRAPTGETQPPNMGIAKHYIDLLDLLREKTAGNVSEDEKTLLDGVLHELRMQYVEVATPGATSAVNPGATPETTSGKNPGAPKV